MLGLVSAFVLLYLLAPMGWAKRLRRPFDALGEDRPPSRPRCFLFHISCFPVLIFVEPRTANPGPLFAVLFLLLAALGAVAVLRERGPLHFVASFFAVAAEAAWSVRHLTVEHLSPALALYAGFGLFYVGVPVLARKLDKRLSPDGSGSVLVLLSLLLLLFLAAGPVASAALWGLGLLLALLNLGLFFEARVSRVPLLALVGVVLSWVVIAVWWATAMVAALLVPALSIVAGFALLIVAGNLWATRGEGPAPTSAFGQGLYLGLVGSSLFLLFVATQPSLSTPPWPMLGVLLVLDLAILVASLYARRAELFAAALGLSQLVLLAWASARLESVTAPGPHSLPAPLGGRARRRARGGGPGPARLARGQAARGRASRLRHRGLRGALPRPGHRGLARRLR